jgi:hypothetical protein
MSEVKMYQFWGIISLGTGTQIKVYVSAPDIYTATQMLKGQYGAQLITQFANPVST